MPAVNLNFQPYEVRIDRKSKWGNKFIIGRDGDRDDVCNKYRLWLWAEIRAGRVTIEDLAKLRGLKLGCHCAPKRCHGDTLSAAAEWAWQRLQQRQAA